VRQSTADTEHAGCAAIAASRVSRSRVPTPCGAEHDSAWRPRAPRTAPLAQQPPQNALISIGSSLVLA
jgi:hypothetical protein